MKPINAITAGGVVLCAASAAAYWYVNRPKPVVSYMDVTLADTKAVVLYKLGVPPNVVGVVVKEGEYKGFSPVYQVDGKDPKNIMPTAKTYSDFDSWHYGSNADYVSVRFKEGKVRRVDCYSRQGSEYCKPLLGVAVGDHEDAIVARIGKPTAARLTGVTKDVAYDDLNVMFVLEKQRVYMLIMADKPTDN